MTPPRTVAEWRAALNLDKFKLASFDRRGWGIVVSSGGRSRMRERRLLVGALEDTRLGALRASLVPEPEAERAPVITDDPRRPIASSEDAIAAFDRLGSDRKAAAELGISRTQLRRLRGKDT